MTPTDIAAARELLRAATPGPWAYWVWGGSKEVELHGLPSSFGVAEDDDRDDGGMEIADMCYVVKGRNWKWVG